MHTHPGNANGPVLLQRLSRVYPVFRFRNHHVTTPKRHFSRPVSPRFAPARNRFGPIRNRPSSLPSLAVSLVSRESATLALGLACRVLALRPVTRRPLNPLGPTCHVGGSRVSR